MVVAVTFYRYYKKKAKGEVNYRWRARSLELVDKIVKHRTKVFTGQLIQLAKAYVEKKVIKYQKDEEDDEIYLLYKRIIREVFLKMCEDMKVC